mgnify:CR=1 FL=1
MEKQKSTNKYHVSGDITIKATTKSIEFPVEISIIESKAVASASITIDRSDFDVKYVNGVKTVIGKS